MRVDLIPHHDRPVSVADSLSIELDWHAHGRLWLRYHAELPLAELELPEPAEPGRADGLWQTTCFELFLREPGQACYYEFNFSPSRRWAAYGFSDVRTGMSELPLAEAPLIFLDASESHFALEATLILPVELADATVDAAVSAVLEEKVGTKSYWALAHPPGKPDFHHPDCFVLELPPATLP